MEGTMITCSILMPVYNGEKYLERALKSVINQTYKEYEVILLDDGSTDSSSKICDKYDKEYSFINVYHQKNAGAMKTREKLLEIANGKYIFWLDQDDYYDETLLQKAVDKFEKENADLVVWGNIVIEPDREIKINNIEDVGVEKWKESTAWGLYPSFLHYAATKELWSNIESRPRDLDLIEDVWFTPQIVQRAKRIISLGECLYYYDSTNTNSMMHTVTANNLARIGLAFYLAIQRNLIKHKGENSLPGVKHIEYVRKYLVNSYCINQLDFSLSNIQTQLIKKALKDLDNLYPQKKTKKFYFLQFCVIHGIDFYCRWYGRGRLKRFEKQSSHHSKM